MTPDRPEDYRGPATLRAGGEELPATVRLSARFEPIDGRFRWAGRTAPDEDLLARVRAGLHEVTVMIAGGGTATARIGDPDPWGGVRLSGSGLPPWISG
jgi:hypothetical protein